MKESVIQQQICEYLSARGFFYFSVPNEHYNISHAQRMTLRKMGLTPGVPDLCVCLPSERVIFFEVKSKTGRVSKEQKIIHTALDRLGFAVYIVRGVGEVMDIMEWEVVE